MEHYLDLALRAIFVENMALSLFLGLCSFLAVSKRMETAYGLSLAVVLVLGVTCPLNQWLLTHLLQKGALGWLHPSLVEVDLGFLVFLTFIATIAAFVQVAEMVIERYAPSLMHALGVFLPLIAVNCAILGAALLTAERDYTFVESAVFGVGAGVGWGLALITLAAIRARLRYSNIPEGLQGLGITFIVTGLMALCFMGFGGIQL